MLSRDDYKYSDDSNAVMIASAELIAKAVIVTSTVIASAELIAKAVMIQKQ